MRTKWVLLILSAILLVTSLSCGGAAIRREEITCKPAATVATSAAGKGKISLAWDLNEKDKPAGFRVFYGLAPGKYKECVDIGKPAESSPGAVKHTLLGLEPGKKYYIAVIAYDKNNNESDFSSEVSATAE